MSDNVESITKQIDKDAADLLRLLARQVDTNLGELHRRVDELSRLRVAYMRAADRLDPIPPDDPPQPLDPFNREYGPRHLADVVSRYPVTDQELGW